MELEEGVNKALIDTGVMFPQTRASHYRIRTYTRGTIAGLAYDSL